MLFNGNLRLEKLQGGRDGWTDRRTDGCTYLRTSGNSPLCPTGHRPFGAATQKGHRKPLVYIDVVIKTPFHDPAWPELLSHQIWEIEKDDIYVTDSSVLPRKTNVWEKRARTWESSWERLYLLERQGRGRQTRPDTRPQVADGWAGAAMRVFSLFDSIITDGRTDGPTDGPMDGQSFL